MADNECIEIEFRLTPKAFREYAKYLVEQGESEDSKRVMWANEQAEALEGRVMETLDTIGRLWAGAINDNRRPVAVSMNETVYAALRGEANLAGAFVGDRVAWKSKLYNMDVLIHGDEEDPAIRVLWRP